MKKKLVLIILLIGPFLLYFSLIATRFKPVFLPVVKTNIVDIATFAPQKNISLKNKISILAFLGDSIQHKKPNILHINQKIYKLRYDREEFQVVVLVPISTKDQVEKINKELSYTTDMTRWHFVLTEKDKINQIYNSLRTEIPIDANAYSSEVFIIDKELNQRGRDDDTKTDDGMLTSYNAESAFVIKKDLAPDLKQVLEEYEMALKKNRKKEAFINPYKKDKN